MSKQLPNKTQSAYSSVAAIRTANKQLLKDLAGGLFIEPKYLNELQINDKQEVLRFGIKIATTTKQKRWLKYLVTEAKQISSDAMLYVTKLDVALHNKNAKQYIELLQAQPDLINAHPHYREVINEQLRKVFKSFSTQESKLEQALLALENLIKCYSDKETKLGLLPELILEDLQNYIYGKDFNEKSYKNIGKVLSNMSFATQDKGIIIQNCIESGTFNVEDLKILITNLYLPEETIKSLGPIFDLVSYDGISSPLNVLQAHRNVSNQIKISEKEQKQWLSNLFEHTIFDYDTLSIYTPDLDEIKELWSSASKYISATVISKYMQNLDIGTIVKEEPESISVIAHILKLYPNTPINMRKLDIIYNSNKDTYKFQLLNETDSTVKTSISKFIRQNKDNIIGITSNINKNPLIDFK